MHKNIDETGQIAKLNLFSGDKDQLLNQIRDHLDTPKNSRDTASNILTIATPNSEIVVQSRYDTIFAALLDQFSIRIPDGAGLVKAAQMIGALPKIRRRIAGVDVVKAVLAESFLASGTVFILGGRGYGGLQYESWFVRDVTKTEGVDNTPDNNKTLWWHYGFLESSDQSPEEEHAIREAIEKIKPVVVFVALGAPGQERWVQRNKEWLAVAGVRVAMVVGGSFDMLLGKITRAPEWMQKNGLEWIYRLYQEPSRWRRQLRLVQFVYIFGLEWFRAQLNKQNHIKK